MKYFIRFSSILTIVVSLQMALNSCVSEEDIKAENDRTTKAFFSNIITNNYKKARNYVNLKSEYFKNSTVRFDEIANHIEGGKLISSRHGSGFSSSTTISGFHGTTSKAAFPYKLKYEKGEYQCTIFIRYLGNSSKIDSISQIKKIESLF